MYFKTIENFGARLNLYFVKSTNKIIIVENNSIFSDNEIVAEKLNNFFIDSVENLEIEPFLTETGRMLNSNAENEIDDIIQKYI